MDVAKGKRRERLDGWLRQGLISRFEGRILPVDLRIGDVCGRLMARSESTGRPIEARDAFIAATAEVHGLTLVTRNVEDVKRLGRRIGNWLTADEAQELLNAVSQSHSAWYAMAEHLRTNPGVNDIYAAVVEIGNIARRELGPSHLGNGRDLRIRVADRSAEQTALSGNFRKRSRCVALEAEDAARQIFGKHSLCRGQEPLATLSLGDQLDPIENLCLRD
jgi:hypothetical protein